MKWHEGFTSCHYIGLLIFSPKGSIGIAILSMTKPGEGRNAQTTGYCGILSAEKKPKEFRIAYQ